MAARAVLVTPLSGPLARFGKAGASALALWADRSGVSLEVIDAYLSAASAIRAAEANRPDVVFGPYGSGPALAAAAALGGDGIGCAVGGRHRGVGADYGLGGRRRAVELLAFVVSECPSSASTWPE